MGQEKPRGQTREQQAQPVEQQHSEVRAPSTDTDISNTNPLQINSCPGGRALGFHVSGLGVVLFIFWLLKTHQLILYGIPDFPILLATLSFSILRTCS